jgi:hypothetical protein
VLEWNSIDHHSSTLLLVVAKAAHGRYAIAAIAKSGAKVIGSQPLLKITYTTDSNLELIGDAS